MFRVHSIVSSPFSRAVVATLREKQAEFSLAPALPGTLRRAEHLARHPFGRIPVLEHDGFTLYETQAILRYIDRVIPAPPLTPNDPRDAARMDQAMNICDWYLYQGVNSVIPFQRLVAPQITGRAPDEAAIAAAIPAAQRVLHTLDEMLDGRTYFAGTSVSLAEMMIAPQIDSLARTPEWTALIAPCASLAAWHERMLTHPAIRSTDWS